MFRRTTLSALVASLLLLAATAAPAAAKGPTEVKIHDLRTGASAVVDGLEDQRMFELVELVGWSMEESRPDASPGALEPLATLTWSIEDTRMWNDRLYSDGSGTTWVERRDFHGGGGRAMWGRVPDAAALDEMLTALVQPADPARSTVRAPDVSPVLEPGRSVAGTDDTDMSRWALALLALPVAGLALVVWRRRSST